MPERTPIIVWDLPTRLFHWTLVVLIVLQFLSGEFELLPMEWHYRFGYVTLALILFRVLWGFFGSRSSRFSDFVRGPVTVARYTIDNWRGRAQPRAGHNPLGGWSIVLMLASVAVQSVSGLFASDDLTESGLLASRVSDATVKWMTRIHSVNRWLLLLLIAAHVIAVALHWLIRHDNLVAAMWHGRRSVEGARPMRVVSHWRAAALLAFSAAAVGLLVVWGGDSPP
ncbi:MAG TPA: cytochrome b/b6 domain-containing protein [Rhodanobacteraceae bacterium]